MNFLVVEYQSMHCLKFSGVPRKIFFSAYHPFFFASDSKTPAIERFREPGKISIDAPAFRLPGFLTEKHHA